MCQIILQIPCNIALLWLDYLALGHQEALKATVDLLDMLGMYLVITKLLGRAEQKVLVTAVGTFAV